MGRVTVVGVTLAGLAASARLAKVGHDVTLIGSPADASDLLPGTLIEFPAPWRDLFNKTGRPAMGTLGQRGLEMVQVTADELDFPTDRGGQWRFLSARFGEPVAVAWRDLLDHYDDVWQALRPLGIEAEYSDAAAKRRASVLEPKVSVADVAGRVPHEFLAEQIRSVAPGDPKDAPGWLVARLALRRAVGVWKLVDADGRTVPAQQMVDALVQRCVDRGVQFEEPPLVERSDHVTIDTRDPGVRWHKPARWRLQTFLDVWSTFPTLRTPDPTRFHASASSPGGAEPWAQIQTGALAAYAAHAHLTGEDIRPSNKELSR